MANADIPEPMMRPIRPMGSFPDTTSGLALKPKACVQCRTRKVKCNRKTPCGNCVRWSVHCVFPSPIRRCRRPRKAAAGASAGSGSTPPAGGSLPSSPNIMQELETTLRAVEDFMKPSQTREAGALSPNQSQGNEQHSPGDTGDWESLQGKLRLAAELVAGLAGNRSLTAPVLPGPTLLGGLSSAFGVLNYPTPQPFPFDTFRLDVSPFHPPPAQIRTSWQAFLLNIDPLVKVLHRSTTERILHKVVRDPTCLTDGETAIVFTIYFSSLSALSDDDAKRCFGITKHAAQSTFKSAAEHALAKINAHDRIDLTSLQAYVLFLSLGRFTDHAPRVWALTGLVRRLDCISASKNKSPFEEEIRRRLRWELWCLDHRAHEDSGRGPAPHDTGGAPELPLNVRDADLDPLATKVPRLAPGWTEISFSLVRFEIARTARTIEFLPSVPEKLTMVDECERRVESAYLCHCDGTQPIHWLARHVAHVLLMELRFKLLRHDQPRNPHSEGPVGTEERPAQDYLFLQAIDIVDTPRRVEAEPQARRWSWLLVGYMQFWPLSFLLRELRYRYGSQEVEQGWEVAERALGRRREDDTSKNMETLRQLMEEARLERSSRVRTEPKEAYFSEVIPPLVDSSPTNFTALQTPAVFEPFGGEHISEQRPGLAGERDKCTGYMGLDDPFLPPAYNGLSWDGPSLAGGGAYDPSGFVFDDGDSFPDADIPAVSTYFPPAM